MPVSTHHRPWQNTAHPDPLYWPLWEAIALLHSDQIERDEVERVTATLRAILTAKRDLRPLGIPTAFFSLASRLVRRLNPDASPGRPIVPQKEARQKDAEALGQYSVVHRMVLETRKQHRNPQAWRAILVTLYGETAVPPLVKLTHGGYHRKAAVSEVSSYIVRVLLQVSERTLKGRLSSARKNASTPASRQSLSRSRRVN
jgi:hypothetical protein